MAKALWFLTLVLVLYIGGVLGGAATTTTTSETASDGHATESPSEAPYVYPTDSMEPANGICPGLGLFQLTLMRQFKKDNIRSLSSGKVVADIVGFIVLGLTAIYIGISNSQYKGHRFYIFHSIYYDALCSL